MDFICGQRSATRCTGRFSVKVPPSFATRAFFCADPICRMTRGIRCGSPLACLMRHDLPITFLGEVGVLKMSKPRPSSGGGCRGEAVGLRASSLHVLTGVAVGPLQWPCLLPPAVVVAFPGDDIVMVAQQPRPDFVVPSGCVAARLMVNKPEPGGVFVSTDDSPV